MDCETTEIRLLLDGIYSEYGYDFRQYAFASIRRRILSRLTAENVHTITELLSKLLHEPGAMERFLVAVTVHTTSMFRDPGFYGVFRRKAVPMLRTYPSVRLWVAGCSTGEEVYSLAMLLDEEGLTKKCRVYATDLSDVVLKRAKGGIFPLSSMKEYTENYIRSGGTRSFSGYYRAEGDAAIFRSSLVENVVFAHHNLVTDASFNSFNVILCRNVMIYFDSNLQNHVHKLIYESLEPLGFLALGQAESLRFTPYEGNYEEVDDTGKLFRRVSAS
ncbi:MAG: protein-glutamate O-methyltransferase CheR [Deltaproteobacteria bacterium]|nr:protein-glutamate O-methyltransferase CheR [Deltaproteobacteria bacterium]